MGTSLDLFGWSVLARIVVAFDDAGVGCSGDGTEERPFDVVEGYLGLSLNAGIQLVRFGL